MESVNQWLQLIAHLVTIAGVPIAICLFYAEKRKERTEREEKTFGELDDKYVEFMQLCLNHPDADMFEREQESQSPTDEQLNVEHALFGVLISLFERAFVMFKDQDSHFRVRQWDGWVLFMKSYSPRKSFQRVWNAIGPQFDSEFVVFFNALIETPAEPQINS